MRGHMFPLEPIKKTILKVSFCSMRPVQTDNRAGTANNYIFEYRSINQWISVSGSGQTTELIALMKLGWRMDLCPEKTINFWCRSNCIEDSRCVFTFFDTVRQGVLPTFLLIYQGIMHGCWWKHCVFMWLVSMSEYNLMQIQIKPKCCRFRYVLILY